MTANDTSHLRPPGLEPRSSQRLLRAFAVLREDVVATPADASLARALPAATAPVAPEAAAVAVQATSAVERATATSAVERATATTEPLADRVDQAVTGQGAVSVGNELPRDAAAAWEQPAPTGTMAT